MKVEPRFCLDRAYKGPFQFKSLTSTNAVIELRNDSNAEAMNVSRQRLSRPPLGWDTQAGLSREDK